MLRIIESTSAAQAKAYFSTADYYSEGQELIGQWRGEAAKQLGLSSVIDSKKWDSLCDNIDPRTGDTLTLRHKESRRVGYDFNFHVPKSVSLLYGLTEDERLLDAFRDAVRETMDDVESEMKTRVRKGGRNEDRTTANLAWGEFVHFTSRPVDGVPDPHLHAHCFVFNTTFDAEERAWKAGQFGDLKRDAPYFEAKFHSRLGRNLADLGLAVERTKTGWEIAGVERSTLDKFSRRTLEIEAQAEKLGISDPAAKAELGAKTRKHKAKDIPFEELKQEWLKRLTKEERDGLAGIEAKIGGERIAERGSVAPEAVRLATDHCFERKSVVPERMLLAESMKRSVGQASAKTVEEAFGQAGLLVRERKGRRMATSREVLAEEQAMLAFARDGRGTRRRLSDKPHEFKRTWLNEGQRGAVEHVLRSTDRVMIVRGAAGVGKTSMMQEAVEAIEANGKQVFTFAPSARASRGVLREKGFATADTVARMLVDKDLQTKLRGQVCWIDEAGLLGSRTMAKVFTLAEQLDARIVLSGDRRQHGSVERGAALRLLEEEAGLIPAEIKEIQRQQDDYKLVVQALSEERTEEGFQRLANMGWIREIDESERYKILAADYLDTVANGETALVVSPTHLESERITNEIRSGLKGRGVLGDGERRIATLSSANLTEAERADAVNISPGDVLIFHQNAKGHQKGERLVVGQERLPMDQAARYQVFHPSFLDVAPGEVLRVTQNSKTLDGKRLNNGDLVTVKAFDAAGNIVTDKGRKIAKEGAFLDYGYVTTSHASQGTDVKRVFIGQSADSFGASSQEQFYVSVSRGQKQATIYTDDKLALLEAVRRSDERLSATELLAGPDGGAPGRDRREAYEPAMRHHEADAKREAVLER